MLLPLGCAYYDEHFSYFNMLRNDSHTIRNKKAAKKFWSGVRPLSTLSDSHYKLGRHYQKRGMHKEAIEEFSKAARNDIHFCKAYNAIGMSYDKLAKCELAQASYEQALQCAPDQAYIYNNYGYSCLLCGNYDKALTMLKKAVQIAGNDNRRINGNLQLAQSITVQPIILKNRQQSDENTPALAIEEIRHESIKNSTKMGYEKFNLDSPQALPPAYAIISEEKRQQALKNEPPPQQTIMSAQIEISNGNGVTGMAGRSAEYLRLLGFKVSRVTNASHFHFTESTIYYREGYLEVAKKLAGTIPGSQEFKKVQSLDWPTLGIRVLLGRNLAQLEFPEKYWQENKTVTHDGNIGPSVKNG